MFNGFAKRIEALEKQISMWESKARKEEKWKKCMEMWLLKNFDFDIQEDLSKLIDSEDPNDGSDLNFDEPVMNYSSFQLAPKQVYNNPHLIVESRPQRYEVEQDNAIKYKLQPNDSEISTLNIQSHSNPFSKIKPAHLNRQSTHSRFQQQTYRNINHQSKSKDRYDSVPRTSAVSTEDRKLSLTSPPLSLEKVPTIQNVHSVVANTSALGHAGSSITLTPLSLPPPLNSQVSELQHVTADNRSAIYLSNNIRHNIGALISNKELTSLKEEVHDSEQDLQDDNWHAATEDDSPEVSSQFHAVELEIHKHNANYEGSSEGRNSSIDLDTSDDIEEFSVEADEHKTVLTPGELHQHAFAGGTGFFSNPKNLPICNFCGKTYSSQTYLKTHIDVVHKGMKAFRCKLCGVCFGFKSDLTRHLRSHLKRKTSSL